MLLFFSVARSASTSQAERANEANNGNGNSSNGAAQTTGEAADAMMTEAGEKMPTDKLLDVTPQALRMSSPFNSAYWLSAA